MHEKKGNWKGSMEIVQEKRNEIAELKRAITLKNRAYKVLKKKYMKLRKDKQVDTLQAHIEKLEKQLKRQGIK